MSTPSWSWDCCRQAEGLQGGIVRRLERSLARSLAAVAMRVRNSIVVRNSRVLRSPMAALRVRNSRVLRSPVALLVRNSTVALLVRNSTVLRSPVRNSMVLRSPGVTRLENHRSLNTRVPSPVTAPSGAKPQPHQPHKPSHCTKRCEDPAPPAPQALSISVKFI